MVVWPAVYLTSDPAVSVFSVIHGSCSCPGAARGGKDGPSGAVQRRRRQKLSAQRAPPLSRGLDLRHYCPSEDQFRPLDRPLSFAGAARGLAAVHSNFHRGGNREASGANAGTSTGACGDQRR
eukprot:1188887-Prorocentrum_minimum.AAC.2